MHPVSVQAPWTVEQGGDGEVPDGAREKVSTMSKPSQDFVWTKLRRNRKKALLSIK